MTDKFSNNEAGLTSPFEDGAEVTPNDSADLATFSRALWIGTGGNVSAVTLKGTTLPFSNVPDGTLLPGRFKRVRATGTTASDIVAVW